MNLIFEKRALQAAIIVLSAVPLLAGSFGMLAGLKFAGGLATTDADSHFRYLSGLLLGIGLGFLLCVPAVETKNAIFRLLTLIVFIGGLARLYGVITQGLPDAPMLFGLAMELAVTPLLCLWQGWVARRSA